MPPSPGVIICKSGAKTRGCRQARKLTHAAFRESGIRGENGRDRLRSFEHGQRYSNICGHALAAARYRAGQMASARDPK